MLGAGTLANPFSAEPSFLGRKFTKVLPKCPSARLRASTATSIVAKLGLEAPVTTGRLEAPVTGDRQKAHSQVAVASSRSNHP